MPQQRAGEALRRQLALGDEGDARRQRRRQHQAVDVARVIRHHDRVRRPLEALGALDPGRRAPQPERQPGPAPPDRAGARRAARGRDQQPGRQHDEDEARPGPGAPQAPGGAPQRARGARREALELEPRELQPGRALAGAERAALVELAAGVAPDLAARGLEHAARRREHHLVGRHADQVDRKAVDLADEARARLLPRLARLREHDQALARAARVRGEHRHRPPADSAHLADRLFELHRVDVVAAADDEVLGASGQVELAAGEIAQVAGVAPAVVDQACSLLRVLVVAAGRRRAAELDPPLDPLAELAPLLVDDPDRVARQRAAAGDQPQRQGIAGARPARDAAALKRGAVDPVDEQAAPERRKADAEAGLGQAVDRGHGVGPQAVAGEALAETLRRLRAHRLGAVEREPQGRKVEPFELAVRELAEAQLVGEVRRRGERAAVMRDAPQPALGPREEGERRHQHQRIAVEQRAEAGADQPHVVVERQPGHEDVGRARLRRRPHRAKVGHQVRVRQHHALGLPGAARGVLQERDVAGRGAVRRHGAAGLRHLLDGQDVAERLGMRAQHVGERLRGLAGDEDPRAAVGHDPRDAAEVLLELRRPRRRIERDRDRPRAQRAVEGGEEAAAGRQHDRDPVARRDAARREPGGEGARGLAERAEADLLGRFALAVEGDVAALGMVREVPVERRGERLDRKGRMLRRGRLARHDDRSNVALGRARRRLEVTQQVARRLGLAESLLGQARAQGLLDPRGELDAREAVQPVVALERIVEPEPLDRGIPRMELACQGTQQLEQLRALRADFRHGLDRDQ